MKLSKSLVFAVAISVCSTSHAFDKPNVVSFNCAVALISYIHNGSMNIELKPNEVLVHFEFLDWKKLPYKEKAAILACVVKVYDAENVRIFKMGSNAIWNILAIYSKEGLWFKIIR